MIIETGSVMIAMPYGAMRTFVKYTRPIMIGKAQSATIQKFRHIFLFFIFWIIDL
jgi:hypothetical protein